MSSDKKCNPTAIVIGEQKWPFCVPLLKRRVPGLSERRGNGTAETANLHPSLSLSPLLRFENSAWSIPYPKNREFDSESFMQNNIFLVRNRLLSNESLLVIRNICNRPSTSREMQIRKRPIKSWNKPSNSLPFLSLCCTAINSPIHIYHLVRQPKIGINFYGMNDIASKWIGAFQILKFTVSFKKVCPRLRESTGGLAQSLPLRFSHPYPIRSNIRNAEKRESVK